MCDCLTNQSVAEDLQGRWQGEGGWRGGGGEQEGGGKGTRGAMSPSWYPSNRTQSESRDCGLISVNSCRSRPPVLDGRADWKPLHQVGFNGTFLAQRLVGSNN